MLEFKQTVFLSLLQGLTEFLPISSSAHLILTPQLAGWTDQGLAFDVAVHVGTLMAVVLYFRCELLKMAKDWGASFTGGPITPECKLTWAVGLGTIPVGLVGLVGKHFIEGHLRSSVVIAVATIVFGLLLGFAAKVNRQERHLKHIRFADILVVGMAQAVALIPGTSRSGITMTAALLLGFTRQAAARYSFLLSIPVIVLAGGLATIDLIQSPQATPWGLLAIAVGISALSAYVCIALFLRLIEKIGFMPFVWYRLFLGSLLLVLIL